MKYIKFAVIYFVIPKDLSHLFNLSSFVMLEVIAALLFDYLICKDIKYAYRVMMNLNKRLVVS